MRHVFYASAYLCTTMRGGRPGHPAGVPPPRPHYFMCRRRRLCYGAHVACTRPGCGRLALTDEPSWLSVDDDSSLCLLPASYSEGRGRQIDVLLSSRPLVPLSSLTFILIRFVVYFHHFLQIPTFFGAGRVLIRAQNHRRTSWTSQCPTSGCILVSITA